MQSSVLKHFQGFIFSKILLWWWWGGGLEGLQQGKNEEWVKEEIVFMQFFSFTQSKMP